MEIKNKFGQIGEFFKWILWGIFAIIIIIGLGYLLNKLGVV